MVKDGQKACVSYVGTFAISPLALLGLVQSVSLHSGDEA